LNLRFVLDFAVETIGGIKVLHFLVQNDQHAFHWRCTVYKSAAEEVSVWGSPLRTSGLLPATLSARHLTLLAGEITEVTLDLQEPVASLP
jgi:hypothetical protein